MDKNRKLELIQRSLGLRHKIKVHDSMAPAQTHDELSHMMLVKWELEDELRAIEEILAKARGEAVSAKMKSLMSEDAGLAPKDRDAAASKRLSDKEKKKSAR
jgi:hypothetical protein